MIGRRSLFGVVLAAGLVAAAWVLGDHAPDVPPSARMADMMLSRVVPGDVALFKDDTVMHGPTFYRFEADAAGVRNLVQLLHLQPLPRLPRLLEGRVAVARSRTGWPFDWDHAQVQAAFHCEPALEDPFDVLLVSGREMVYVTSGFAGGLPKDAPIVADPDSCPGNPLDASGGVAASAVPAPRPMGTASGHPD
ncbi:MAG TPA: hypothetical protein VIP05_23680 [Burkholderiaceae bacterium]